jgi:hypothetical protein
VGFAVGQGQRADPVRALGSQDLCDRTASVVGYQINAAQIQLGTDGADQVGERGEAQSLPRAHRRLAVQGQVNG